MSFFIPFLTFLKRSHDLPLNSKQHQLKIQESPKPPYAPMPGTPGQFSEDDKSSPRVLDEAKADPLQSPLHRLQTEIAKDKKYSIERSPSGGAFRIKDLQHGAADDESIYSFDSVSTSGRLLDRLDLDPDEYDDAWLRRRESTFLVQSTGRLLDRLGLEDETTPPASVQHANSLSSTLTVDTRYVPIRANSSLGMERLRSASKVPVRSDSVSSKFPVKSAPVSLVKQPVNNSFDSLHGDISLASPTSALSLASLDGGHYSGGSKSSSSHDVMKNLRQDSGSPFNPHLSSALPRPGPVDLHQNFQKQRSASGHSISSLNSVSSLDCALLIFNPAPLFDSLVEISLRKAVSLRIENNHREASYQLQILANPPVNYPKAMCLYAKALHVGQGVKQNYLQSVRWLCRCILVCYMLEFTPPSDTVAINSYVTKLTEILPQQLINVIVRNISEDRNDPFLLFEHFKTLSQTLLNKIASLNAKDGNILGSAYYALGNALIFGQGVAKDEEKARLLYAKSASVGYSDAMVTLGELWTGKSKSFKKDLHLSAAWLRLGELFGKKDMGNSWIYKDKYMERKKVEDEKKSSKDRKLF